MRNTRAYAFLSVVVLALALALPTTAQFASNDRSFKLRETASANVTTPAAGSAAFFRDTVYHALLVKDSAGVVSAPDGRAFITTLTASTTLSDTHLGEVIVYNGDASATLALPEITATNIGMRYEIIALDTDDLIVTCVAADLILPTTGTADSDDSVTATTAGARMVFTAVSATTWVLDSSGTVTIS